MHINEVHRLHNRVRMNKSTSHILVLKEGLQQGTVLSAIPFMININSLLDKFDDITLVSVYVFDLVIEVRMEVASSRPHHLPTLSAAKTSDFSLLVKSLFWRGTADFCTAALTFASVCRRYRNDPWTGLDTNTK